jgi:hypothetical protein
LAGAADGCATSEGASRLPIPDVAAGATPYQPGAPALGHLHGQARDQQQGEDANNQILVDGIKAVATHNHLLRIECVGLGPNNEERSAGTLLIPGNQAGRILLALMQAVHELDKKVRQPATAGQPAN